MQRLRRRRRQLHADPGPAAGAKANEQSLAAASRLQDIEDILNGLVLIYDNVQPAIAEADAAQAQQTGRELKQLRDFAADLRAKEQAGTKFGADAAEYVRIKRPRRLAERRRREAPAAPATHTARSGR